LKLRWNEGRQKSEVTNLTSMSKNDSDSDPRESAERFDEIVKETITERITATLGGPASKAYARYLQVQLGVTLDEMPAHLDIVFDSLRRLFGVGGDILGKMIVRDIYRKCGVELNGNSGARPMEDVIQQLKVRVSDLTESSNERIRDAGSLTNGAVKAESEDLRIEF